MLSSFVPEKKLVHSHCDPLKDIPHRKACISRRNNPLKPGFASAFSSLEVSIVFTKMNGLRKYTVES